MVGFWPFSKNPQNGHFSHFWGLYSGLGEKIAFFGPLFGGSSRGQKWPFLGPLFWRFLWVFLFFTKVCKNFINLWNFLYFLINFWPLLGLKKGSFLGCFLCLFWCLFNWISSFSWCKKCVYFCIFLTIFGHFWGVIFRVKKGLLLGVFGGLFLIPFNDCLYLVK